MNKFFLLFVALLLGVSGLVAQPGQEAKLAERYVIDGEYESALELYTKLYRRYPSENYARQMVLCYENLQQFDEAIKFLTKVSKRQTDNPIYPTLLAGLLEKTGDLKGADKLYEEIINKKLKSEGEFIKIGSYLYKEGKLDIALEAYLKARKKLKDPYRFANEIANIHVQQGEFGKATDEYLNLYRQDPLSNYSTVNLSILNLLSPSSEEQVENVLLRALDKTPSDRGLRNILFEFYVLAENFMEAFIQVKSIDKLFKEDGIHVFQFAETMRNNQNYSLSNKAYDYIIQKHKDSQYFFQAHFQKAINSELQAFDQLPVDQEAIRSAVEAYGDLLDEFGRNPAYHEPIYRRAKLMVFYLDELDQAKKELEDLTVTRQGISDQSWAKSKLLLGDIHLIQQNYNQAKLTYTEVSELFTDRQLGALAKYKLAQLAYYKGEFNLSQALLSAIKDNTSNDISNDAIKLNLTIIDNTGLDTTTTALEMFAEAQLLTYQRKYDSSLIVLDSLALGFSDHPLADEILWEKATIYLKQNKVERALGFIDRILENFPYDIFGDDALYTKARLYDFTLSNPELAMKYYLEFLGAYPGSLFSVEVRKRIKELRQGS
ncbi:MAG: tetratricopeptide repeat protein [Bacteroidota bacterium]